MTLIDRHDVTARIDGRTVRVLEMATTLDRGWAPYVQGSLTIDDPDIKGLLDPRKRPVVRITMGRRYSGSRSLGYVSALDAGKKLGAQSALHSGKKLGQVSALHREVWNGPGGKYGKEKPLIITARLTDSRRRRTDPDKWEIEFEGGEVRAQNLCSTVRSRLPSARTTRGLVRDVLQVSTLGTLAPGSTNSTLPLNEEGDGPEWLAGVSVWDYLNPIIQAEEMRLYVDELGAWRIEADDTTRGSITLAPEATEITDNWSSGGRFFDGAVLIYEWETAGGQPRKVVEAYRRGNVSTYVEHVEGRRTRTGRAKRIVDRAYRRALSQTWEAVADYDVRPGQSVTLPTGDTGVIDAVTWNYPDATMNVTVLDVT